MPSARCGAAAAAGLDLGLSAVVDVEDAPAALALQALAVTQLVPQLRTKAHLATCAALIPRAGDRGAARGGDAVVLRQAVFIDLGTKRGAFGLPLREVGLFERGAPRRGSLLVSR